MRDSSAVTVPERHLTGPRHVPPERIPADTASVNDINDTTGSGRVAAAFPGTRAPFYWELSPEQRDLEEPFGLEEEGYLALELKRGSALLEVPHRYESW